MGEGSGMLHDLKDVNTPMEGTQMSQGQGQGQAQGQGMLHDLKQQGTYQQ